MNKQYLISGILAFLYSFATAMTTVFTVGDITIESIGVAAFLSLGVGVNTIKELRKTPPKKANEL